MAYLNDPARPLKKSIGSEVDFDRAVARGDRGLAVRKAQEWCCLHGHRLVIDGVFGPATEAGIKSFQRNAQISRSGRVDRETFDKLVAPMRRVLARPARHDSFADTVSSLAKQHLAEHPREVGGQNRGPWVRMYMDGNEGRAWPWCAGFVTFILKQAAEATGSPMPIKGSFSCDVLAMQAKAANRFCKERDIRSRAGSDTAVFLVRRTSTDWIHTGFTMGFGREVMETLEGNTNDEGSREGYEVCERIRSYASKDLILLA